jgi:hypothetical protein
MSSEIIKITCCANCGHKVSDFRGCDIYCTYRNVGTSIDCYCTDYQDPKLTSWQISVVEKMMEEETDEKETEE